MNKTDIYLKIIIRMFKKISFISGKHKMVQN